jgi:pyruvate dehydrogenase E2 component (dihydrolipoamide acetyltransferase)
MRARAVGMDLSTLAGSGPNGRIVEADVFAAGATALEAAPSESRVLITPLARRLAQERGVAIGDLVGSGPGGRITQDDVVRAADQRAPAADRADQRAPAAPADRRIPAVAEPAPVGVAALSRVRRITAERMAASAQATARVTLFLEADFSEAARFRSQLQPEFARLGTPKLPWDALIAKAAALALVDHSAVAAQWVDGQGLRPPESAHLGIGVAVTLEPEGLVVPVLKDADSRSLRELATDLLALVDKARAGRLSPLEMHGGSFTITNLGAYRVDGFTPIINPPETAILGVGRIADKAVVVDGQVQARTMCTLSLSFDHRVVDGAPAAAFLARLAELLERPYALLGI